MEKVIGIISYLPDDSEAREVRFNRLLELINSCNETFNLPFMIVAQNWSTDDVLKLKEIVKTEIILSMNKKLGITLARETLRQLFSNSDYEYIICFDDDFELVKDKKLGDKYLKFIDKNSDCIIEYENFLMNLLGLPKSIYSANPYDLKIDPEKGLGYEDWIYVTVLKNKYKNRYKNTRGMNFNLSLKDRHTMTIDKYSTWKNEEKEDQTTISKKLILSKLLGDKYGKIS